jgi:hypothetical protein
VQQVNLKLNPSKWRFKLNSIKFMGFELGINVVKPTIEAVVDKPLPSNVKSVHRFLVVLYFQIPLWLE